MSEVAELVRFKSREAEPVVCLKQRSVGEENGVNPSSSNTCCSESLHRFLQTETQTSSVPPFICVYITEAPPTGCSPGGGGGL